MKKSLSSAPLARFVGGAIASLALLTVPIHAATITFTGGTSNEYTDPTNWSTGSVPNLTSGDTALLNSGAAVTYTPGGDLLISSGSTLEVKSGSYTQVGGNNYIQLGNGVGSGNILVDGGTFNQGTDSANPFNVTGTNNTFTITSGAANFNNSLNLQVGMTYLQSGGTVSTGTNELDFNSVNNTISGGILNTSLMTGVNAPGASEFNVSGGLINLSDSRGIYPGGANQYVNFTLNSTGTLSFNGGTSSSDVLALITSGQIEFNNTVDSTGADFSITNVGGNEVLTLVAAVPEPSTYLMMGFGLAALLIAVRRKQAV